MTSVGGENRFASSVARKLEELGALTQADRRATSRAGLGLEEFNLENKYGRQALFLLLRAIHYRCMPEEVKTLVNT